MWFAHKAMFNVFKTIDLFTHSEEKRNLFFPLDLLKNPYQILPNYPMIELHGGSPRKIESNTVKLIFSGVITHDNGLEDLIRFIHTEVHGKQLQLILKGFIKPDYLEVLKNLVKENNVQDKVTFVPVGPWKEVPELLRTANIGIHIFSKADLISKTMGKGGSGKVFQYIAEGLPVLMSHGFKNNFEEYDWAVPTKLDDDSLLQNISYVVENYDALSTGAISSFKTELSCNNQFDKIFKSLMD